jgi:PTH1 family peptidyl-tRNA hydrolase
VADLLVVGLGNPGAQYARTRHNIGADVVDLLARRHGGSLKRSKDHALVTDVRIDGRQVVLAFPQTYMNDSGRSVAPLMRRHGIDDPAKLVVVHDELDLPVGRLRVKVGGGLAGHNGLKSIKAHLHSDAFVRVRIGVGKPPDSRSGADHVLRRLGKSEQAELERMAGIAADAIETIVTDGPDTAMAKYNAPTPS